MSLSPSVNCRKSNKYYFFDTYGESDVRNERRHEMENANAIHISQASIERGIIDGLVKLLYAKGTINKETYINILRTSRGLSQKAS